MKRYLFRNVRKELFLLKIPTPFQGFIYKREVMFRRHKYTMKIRQSFI